MLEEEGAYIRLLRISWENPKCQIPADDTWIKRRMRIQNQTEYDVVCRILAEFFVRSDGYWRNTDLQLRYEAAARASLAKSSAGEKGGRASAQKRQERRASGAADLLEANRQQDATKPEPDSISITACRPAFIDEFRRCLGPRPGAREVTDQSISEAASAWLGKGATESEIFQIVTQRTAKANWAKIHSLSALTPDIAAVIASRWRSPQHASAPSKPLRPPNDPIALRCFNAIVEHHGEAAAKQWLDDAVWKENAVVAPSDFSRQRIEIRFGAELNEFGFSVVSDPSLVN